MKNYIEELCDISHPSLDVLKNYFEQISVEKNHHLFPINLPIYKKTEKDRLKSENVVDLKKSEFIKIIPLNYMDEIYNFIGFLQATFDLEIVWLMIYPPNSHLSFHCDSHSNRHLIALNEHDRFFNYESRSISYEFEKLYNQKLDEMKSEIDNFNEFFLKEPDNRIIKLKNGKVYQFNNSLHTFFNGSNKYRFNLVFEVVNCLIK